MLKVIQPNVPDVLVGECQRVGDLVEPMSFVHTINIIH